MRSFFTTLALVLGVSLALGGVHFQGTAPTVGIAQAKALTKKTKRRMRIKRGIRKKIGGTAEQPDAKVASTKRPGAYFLSFQVAGKNPSSSSKYQPGNFTAQYETGVKDEVASVKWDAPDSDETVYLGKFKHKWTHVMFQHKPHQLKVYINGKRGGKDVYWVANAPVLSGRSHVGPIAMYSDADPKTAAGFVELHRHGNKMTAELRVATNEKSPLEEIEVVVANEAAGTQASAQAQEWGRSYEFSTDGRGPDVQAAKTAAPRRIWTSNRAGGKGQDDIYNFRTSDFVDTAPIGATTVNPDATRLVSDPGTGIKKHGRIHYAGGSADVAVAMSIEDAKGNPILKEVDVPFKKVERQYAGKPSAETDKLLAIFGKTTYREVVFTDKMGTTKAVKDKGTLQTITLDSPGTFYGFKAGGTLFAVGGLKGDDGNALHIATRFGWKGRKAYAAKVRGTVVIRGWSSKPKAAKKGGETAKPDVTLTAVIRDEWRTYKLDSEDYGVIWPKAFSEATVVTTLLDAKGNVISEERTTINGEGPERFERAFGFGKGTRNSASNSGAKPELL